MSIAKSEVWILVVAAGCLVCLTGLFTGLRFGDELLHYWLALEWFQGGRRPVGESLNFLYYVYDPMWHFGLSRLMWVFGPSVALAQVYQALFFVLLGVGTYLLARELYGEEQGRYAVVLIISTPLFLAFGVLFFIDLPIASLSPFLLLSLKKGRIFRSGLILGVMFLMKKNSYLLLPALTLLTLAMPEYSMGKRMRNLVVILAVAIAMTVPDMAFRMENFKGVILPGDKLSVGGIIHSLSASPLGPIPSAGDGHQVVSNVYFNESVTISSNALKFLGVALPLTFLFSLTRYYRQLRKDDSWVLLPILLYVPLYLFFFKHHLSARYLSPILPCLAVFASRGFTTIGVGRVLKVALITLCLTQVVATLGYVYENRRVTPMEEEALRFISAEISQGEKILTPEDLFVSYYTGRSTLWVRYFNRDDFDTLLWGEVEANRKMMQKYDIRYVLVQNARVYDDSQVRHYGGLPSSFVEKLPSMAKKVWENASMTLWRVM